MIRYTKKARAVAFYAYEQANRERSKEVSAEHLLVGLLRADESLATRCGLIIEEVCRELAKAPRECRTATSIVLSDSAKQAILLAAEERERFGHNHTGTEHLLLGISRGSSDAAKTLENRGLTIQSRTRFSQSPKPRCRMENRAGFDFNWTIAVIRRLRSKPLAGVNERYRDFTPVIQTRRTRKPPRGAALAHPP